MDQYRGRADHPMVCVIKESIEKREAPNKGFAFFQAVEKGEKSYFPKLIARLRGLAPKPPQSLCSLRGLGRLAVPLESSERFSKY